MSICPFCQSEVSQMKINHLDLRMCPHCFSIFFPCNQTTALRADFPDKSREIWYQKLKEKKLPELNLKSVCCIDHGEPLVDGKIPDYGIEGKVTTCCQMFHLTPSMTLQILKRTIDTPFQTSIKSNKHHFFFIKALDALVEKLIGEKQPEEDPFDLIPYNLHLKKFFE